MEESEKRKERLKAMQMEAAHAVVPNIVENSAVPGVLSNPLSEEASSILSVQGEFRATPRFDYYTDPMAAYTGNKTRARSDNQSTQNYFTRPTGDGWPRVSTPHQGPRNYDVNPPFHHMQSQYSHDQGMYQPQGPRSSFTSLGSPIIRSPSYVHHGNSGPWNGSQATANYYSSDSAVSPRGTFGTPRVSNPSNAPRYCNLPSPGFSPANNPYGRGRSQMFGNIPLHGPGHGGNHGLSSGRGGGRGYGGSTNHGIGRSGGRGRGSTSNMSLGPEHFYDESMLEDPWQNLEPVLWRRKEVGLDALSTPDSSNSWLPKSISTKRAKVSEASDSNKFNSQQSLAEFLAASFNKAVEDTQHE